MSRTRANKPGNVSGRWWDNAAQRPAPRIPTPKQGRTTEINTLIIKVLPLIGELLKQEDSVLGKEQEKVEQQLRDLHKLR